MSEAAMIHILTIGMPFYALTIIESQINKAK